MDEAIKKAVQAYVEIGDEDAIKKLNKKTRGSGVPAEMKFKISNPLNLCY